MTHDDEYTNRVSAQLEPIVESANTARDHALLAGCLAQQLAIVVMSLSYIGPEHFSSEEQAEDVTGEIAQAIINVAMGAVKEVKGALA